MKKIISLFVISAFLFTLVPLQPVVADNGNVFILYAGQNIEVGTVTVSNDTENLYVEYKLDEDAIEEGWCITETHVHVGESPDDFPINRGGNPQIGHFNYKEKHDCVTSYSQEIDLAWGVDTEILIAAHAVIEKEECEEFSYTIVSDEETKYKDGESLYNSVLTWVHPSWHSISGAEWIWKSEDVENPREEETVNFQRNFEIQGIPTSGNLLITADNEYEASINSFIGSGNDWSTINNYDITDHLDTGTNVFDVIVKNWAQAGGNSQTNPAGLIYKMEIESEECVLYKESAWVDGERFTQRGNWATYFTYTIEDHEAILQSVIYEGTCNKFGSHVGDTMTFTFSNNIKKEGIIEIIFEETQKLSQIWGKTDWDISDNILTITATEKYSNLRNLLEEKVMSVSGLVDAIDNNVVVPDGGVEIQMNSIYPTIGHSGTFTSIRHLPGEWEYDISITRDCDNEFISGTIALTDPDGYAIMSEIKEMRYNNTPKWSQYDPNMAAVGTAIYKGEDYNFMFLYAEVALQMALSNDSYDNLWESGNFYSASQRIYDIHSTITWDFPIFW